MPAEQQVASIYAATKGFLDDVPVEAVRKFEDELVEYLKTSKPEVLQSIKEKKVLDKDVEAALQSAVAEFKKGFSA